MFQGFPGPRPFLRTFQVTNIDQCTEHRIHSQSRFDRNRCIYFNFGDISSLYLQLLSIIIMECNVRVIHFAFFIEKIHRYFFSCDLRLHVMLAITLL